MTVNKVQLENFIKEAVLTALEEAKFDPKVITQRNFPSLRAAIEFVKDKVKLRFLGSGSSRTVFALDSKRALKLAKNHAGVAQNQAEMSVATDSHNGLVARIFEYDPKYKWVVSELVRPINNSEEFRALTGISWSLFASLIYSFNWKEDVERLAKNFLEPGDDLAKIIQNPFLNNAMTALRSINDTLLEGDLARVSHWGKTPDQRVVLLDYGFTQEVADDYY